MGRHHGIQYAQCLCVVVVLLLCPMLLSLLCSMLFVVYVCVHLQGSGNSASSEAERLEAVWAHKSTLSKGLSLFSTSPVKGVRFLIAQGIITEKTPTVSCLLRVLTGGA